MKKYIIITLLLLGSIGGAIAQKDFTWSKVDSVGKEKTQIYSDTKMFIANYWRSSQDVTQNNDAEAGILLVKGNTVFKVAHTLNVYTYLYRYTITFRVKDNKYKITIDNVYCDKAYVPNGVFSVQKIQPFEGSYTGKGTMRLGNTLPARKADPMMANLKKEMQDIIDSYVIYIQEVSDTVNEW